MNRTEKTASPAPRRPGTITGLLVIEAVLMGLGSHSGPCLGQERKKTQPQSLEAGVNRGTERVPRADEGPVDYRARWAVIIGIDKYPGGKSGLEPLLFAANDAQAVRDILHQDFGYDKDHLSLIDEEDSTHNGSETRVD